MKVIYMEQIEHRKAWHEHMFCAQCGGYKYEVVEIKEPAVEDPWYVRCPNCKHESTPAPDRATAIERWKREC